MHAWLQIMPERSADLTAGLRVTRVQVGADDLFDNRSLGNTPAPLHFSIEREPLYGHDELPIDRSSADGFSEHRTSRHRRVGGRKKSAQRLRSAWSSATLIRRVGALVPAPGFC